MKLKIIHYQVRSDRPGIHAACGIDVAAKKPATWDPAQLTRVVAAVSCKRCQAKLGGRL